MSDQSENIEDGISIFHWKNQKRYRCNQVWESGDPCAFDTYDLAELRRHVTEPHNRTGRRAQAQRRVLSPIVGPSGEAIVRDDAEFRGVAFKPED